MPEDELELGMSVTYDVFPEGINITGIVVMWNGVLAFEATGEWAEYFDSIDMSRQVEVEFVHDWRIVTD